MSYKIPKGINHRVLTEGHMGARWECEDCGPCILSDRTETNWTCFRLTSKISSDILERLVEYNVITKVEAMDLMLVGRVE